MCWNVLKCVEMCWNVLKCVEMCWNVLKCVEMCWNVLKCVEMCWNVCVCVLTLGKSRSKLAACWRTKLELCLCGFLQGLVFLAEHKPQCTIHGPKTIQIKMIPRLFGNIGIQWKPIETTGIFARSCASFCTFSSFFVAFFSFLAAFLGGT